MTLKNVNLQLSVPNLKMRSTCTQNSKYHFSFEYHSYLYIYNVESEVAYLTFLILSWFKNLWSLCTNMRNNDFAQTWQ